MVNESYSNACNLIFDCASIKMMDLNLMNNAPDDIYSQFLSCCKV